MSKPTIVTRTSKGSPLSWAEGDANFTNLQNSTITVTDGTNSKALDLNSTLTFTAGTNITLNVNSSTGAVTINSAAGGLSDIVNDLSPQLGNNLDLNGFSIVTTNNQNLYLSPNGSGRVYIDGYKFPENVSSITGAITYIDTGRTPNTITLNPNTGINMNDIITFTGADSIGLITGTQYKIWAGIGGGAYEIALASGGGTITLTSNSVPGGNTFTVAGSGPSNGQALTYSSTGLTWSTVSTDLLSPGPIGTTTPSIIKCNTITFKSTREEIYDLGTMGGTVSPDVMFGSVQKITLNSALTINGFSNPMSGQSLTLIIYGGTSYADITSTMKFAGGIKTLTATAGCIDILTVYYDGANYFASLGKGFA